MGWGVGPRGPQYPSVQLVQWDTDLFTVSLPFSDLSWCTWLLSSWSSTPLPPPLSVVHPPPCRPPLPTPPAANPRHTSDRFH